MFWFINFCLDTRSVVWLDRKPRQTCSPSLFADFSKKSVKNNNLGVLTSHCYRRFGYFVLLKGAKSFDAFRMQMYKEWQSTRYFLLIFPLTGVSRWTVYIYGLNHCACLCARQRWKAVWFYYLDFFGKFGLVDQVSILLLSRADLQSLHVASSYFK